MNEQQLLGYAIQGLALLGGLIVALVTVALVKIWAEIGKLRAVRHKNLDHITQMDAKLTLLEFKVDDLSKLIYEKHNETKAIIENNQTNEVLVKENDYA